MQFYEIKLKLFVFKKEHSFHKCKKAICGLQIVS